MNTLSQKSIFTGAIAAALGVAFGAFGAHQLRPMVDAHYFEVFETAVRYQMYHALALILLGCCLRLKPLPAIIYYLFIGGIILFSGSLYAIVFNSVSGNNPIRWVGVLTPLGGFTFISAWLIFAYYTIKK